MLLRLALIFLVLYVALSAGNTACVHQLGGFQRIADAPTAVTEAACSHADNRLFVIMGFTKFNTTTGQLPPSGLAFSLDLNTGVWAQHADAPFQGSHAAAANNGTHVFLAGGFRGVAPGTAQTNVSVFSIATNTWSSLPSIPIATAAASLAYYNGELFFFGGLTDADTPTNATYVLNLTAVHAAPSSSAANWTALSSTLPSARSHAAALVLPVQSPFILLPGGAIGNSSMPIDLNTSLTFNLTSLLFSDAASMPSNRSHYGSDVANASGCCPVRALVLGGRDISVPRVLDTIIEYSPDENIWTPVGNLPHQLFSPCAAFHVNATGSFLFVTVGGLDFFLPTNETIVAPVASICNVATTPFVTPGPTASLPVTAPPLPTPGPTTSATAATTGGAATTTGGASTTGTAVPTTAPPSTNATTAPPGNTTAPPGNTTAPPSNTTAPPSTNSTTAPPPTNGTSTTAPPPPTNGTSTTAPPSTTASPPTTAPPSPPTTAPPTTSPPTTAPTTTSPTSAPPTTLPPTTPPANDTEPEPEVR